MEFIRTIYFSVSKDTIEVKRQHTLWEKTFTNHITDKTLVCRKCKECLKLCNKRQLSLKRQRICIDFSLKNTPANKHMKRCVTSSVTRNLQIKTKMRYHFTLSRMAVIKNADNNKYYGGYGEMETVIQC